VSLENLNHPSGHDGVDATYNSNQRKSLAQNLAAANLAICSAHPSQVTHTPLSDVVGARLFGASLDGRLAEGESPATSRILAARAQLIVSPARRRELAQSWLSLLEPPDAPATFMMFPDAQPVRERIIANEALIHTLVAALIAPMTAPRGVAMARILVTDEAGPLYSRDCLDDLSRTLREIILRLNPLTA
jgi:hypothetical protein